MVTVLVLVPVPVLVLVLIPVLVTVTVTVTVPVSVTVTVTVTVPVTVTVEIFRQNMSPLIFTTWYLSLCRVGQPSGWSVTWLKLVKKRTSRNEAGDSAFLSRAQRLRKAIPLKLMEPSTDAGRTGRQIVKGEHSTVGTMTMTTHLAVESFVFKKESLK